MPHAHGTAGEPYRPGSQRGMSDQAAVDATCAKLGRRNELTSDVVYGVGHRPAPLRTP